MAENKWKEGNRAAYTSMLSECVRKLGYQEDTTKEQLIIERERAISALREVCKEFGDNDWEDNLDLSDIINKHFACYLG